MITIIHGDDVVASRKKLTEIIQKFPKHERFTFVGEKANLTDIVEVFEAQSLFGLQKLIVLEEFIKTRDKTLIAKVLNYIKRNADHEVIFWERGEMKKELLALFPKSAEIFFFKEPVYLFQFLDSIKPHNAEKLLPLFHEVLKKESEELVFYMIVRQLRILLGIATRAQIAEVARLAPWQRSKLEKQTQLFTKDRLAHIYKQLFTIERAVKTGTNSLPLVASLDLFLSDI